MSAAAATSGKRVLGKELRKSQTTTPAMRRTASRNRRALKHRAHAIFKELSSDGKWLMESQVTELLERAMKRPHGSLKADGVELVVDSALHLQKKENINPPAEFQDGRALSEDALLGSIEKYGEYIKNAKKIDKIFEKYNKHQDGLLSKSELLKMLKNYEANANREWHKIDIDLEVTKEDVDWIVEEVDSDGDGKINHAEYLLAIAAWEELAQLKAEGHTKCSIM